MRKRRLPALFLTALFVFSTCTGMISYAGVVSGSRSASSMPGKGNSALAESKPETETLTVLNNTPAAETTSATETKPDSSAAAGQTTAVANSALPEGKVELVMLANQSFSQMESFVIRTKSGKVIVVDGGTEEDEAHLKEVLLADGGHVSAWLITHPHSDHVGALTKLLNEGASSGITIDSVYYNFTSIEWYQENEPYRAQMVADCAAALATMNPVALHPNVQKGDVIDVDDARITVMNAPYLFATNAINNSSVVYKVELNGKKIMFLGDLGTEAGNSFLNEYKGVDLSCDIVQMSHHGENGVSRQFYERLHPSVCFWNTPAWLWDNVGTNGTGTGNYDTITVRQWMRDLKVSANYVMKDGDQTMRW